MPNKNARFSKATVAAYLEYRINLLKRDHGFDETQGYAQVDGCADHIQRAYGEFTAYLEILGDLINNKPVN